MRKSSPLNPFKILFCVLITFVFFVNVSGKRLPVKIYTSADGLGSSFVDWMFRDSRDFMWFCTRDGLSRFDGSEFVTYQIGDKESSPGIETIYETRDGNYWVSTTGGLFRFGPDRISQPDSETPRIAAEFVSGWRGSLLEDSRGNLWLSSAGIFRLEKKNGKDEFVKVEWDLPSNPNVTFVSYEIIEASDRSIWFNTNFGLIRLLPDERIIFYQDEEILVGGVGTASMIIDKNGRIWLTKGNRVLVIKPEPIGSLPDSGRISIKDLKSTAQIRLKKDETVSLPRTSGEIFQYTDTALDEKFSGMRMLQTSDGTIWISAESNLFEFSGGILRFADHDGAFGRRCRRKFMDRRSGRFGTA